jgi:hypothetical protein
MLSLKGILLYGKYNVFWGLSQVEPGADADYKPNLDASIFFDMQLF